MKAAIFWVNPGDPSMPFGDRAIICRKEDCHGTCADLLIKEIMSGGPRKEDDGQVWVPALPPLFDVVFGEDEQRLRWLTIAKVLDGDLPGHHMVPTFIFLTNRYDTQTRFLNASIEDQMLALALTVGEKKKERLSIRVDRGLAEKLQALGRGALGDYLEEKIGAFILPEVYPLGNLRDQLPPQFFFMTAGPWILSATEKGLALSSRKDVLTYKPTGRSVLVNYSIPVQMLTAVRDLSERKAMTITDVISTAIGRPE